MASDTSSRTGLMIEDLVTKLRRRKVDGSLDNAKRTAVLMRQVIADSSKLPPAELLVAVRTAGKRLTDACRTELSTGNVVRRVLHLIREETAAVEAAGDDAASSEKLLDEPSTRQARGPSLATLLEVHEAPPAGGVGARRSGGTAKQHDAAARKNWQVRQNVLDAVNELIDELDGIQQLISDQALEHVHSNEVILTFGYCRTVYLFLREAAKKRHFQVVVAEGAPAYEGQKLACQLANDGLQTTCITDSAVFAMMARANMVLLGAHAVLANGGMLCTSGSHMVALAAARHAVPVVVLTGMHKLSPVFPHEEDTTLNDLRSPCEILDFDAIADSLSADGHGVGPDLHAVNPLLSYIPPHLISLFITNDGCHCPSYVYRLLTEMYSPEDYTL